MCGSKLRVVHWGPNGYSEPILDGTETDDIPIGFGELPPSQTMLDLERQYRDTTERLNARLNNQRSEPMTKMKSQPGSTSSDTFTCDADITGCPIMSEHKTPRVRVPFEMYNTWVFLAMKFNTEWIAYLKGNRNEEGDYVITDMYFPEQVASGAHVSAVDLDEGGTPIEPGTIAAVHSHVGMNVFFSTEDERHFNHEVELVVNRRGDIACCVRIELQCKRSARNKDAKVLLVGSDKDIGLVETLRSKLKEDRQPGPHVVTYPRNGQPDRRNLPSHYQGNYAYHSYYDDYETPGQEPETKAAAPEAKDSPKPTDEKEKVAKDGGDFSVN